MLVRRTEDPAYWQRFRPDRADLQYVAELIRETGRPMYLEELARALVYRRVHEERERIRRLVERGRFYRPADRYELNEEVIFPVLDYAVGVVVGKRPGRWPGHPPFEVIQVQLGETVREFAAAYAEPHKLNELEFQATQSGEGMTPAAIYEQLATSVPAALRAALAADTEFGFVSLGRRWFLRALMPEVHVGYLNLAEAVIDVAWEQAAQTGGGQRPLTTEEILEQIELPGPSQAANAFALALALSQDERFIDVGDGEQHLWLLRRLVPSHALQKPERLQYQPVSYSPEALPTEMLELIWGVVDELSTMEVPPERRARESGEVTFALPYPHRRAGTLPLAGAVAHLFPQREDGVSVVTLLDELNDEAITAWVVHKDRYVASLAEWYERYQVPAGALLTVARTARPDVLRIRYQQKRRTQREYVRVAVVQGDRLTFEIRRMPMSVEFDETMIMLDDDPAESDRLWRAALANRKPFSQIVREVFGQLAQLSPQGTVHFNTLYTAVNVIRRCPPEPLLAELALDWRYVVVGNGFFAMDERTGVKQ